MPAEDDIIWDMFNKTSYSSYIKQIFLTVMLFVISVIILTPLTLANWAEPIAEALNDSVLANSIFEGFLP